MFNAAVQFCKGKYTNTSLWLWLCDWLSRTERQKLTFHLPANRTHASHSRRVNALPLLTTDAYVKWAYTSHIPFQAEPYVLVRERGWALWLFLRRLLYRSQVRVGSLAALFTDAQQYSSTVPACLLHNLHPSRKNTVISNKVYSCIRDTGKSTKVCVCFVLCAILFRPRIELGIFSSPLYMLLHFISPFQCICWELYILFSIVFVCTCMLMSWFAFVKSK